VADGDVVNEWPLLESGWRCFGDLCPRSKAERSSFEGFFHAFFGWTVSVNSPSMSSSAMAFAGRPLAMAEFDVCCEMESGRLALS
jgi:hypothetical protein